MADGRDARPHSIDDNLSAWLAEYGHLPSQSPPQEPARVHLGLGGVNAKDVRPGARIATDPKLLKEPLPPELRPKSPENPTTAADAAAGDLARRLASWSATWGSRVEALRLGTDPV